MPQPKEKPATYADIEALPLTHPRPAPRHAGAATALGMIKGNPYQLGTGGPGGWIFVDEPELHLGPHVAVPDIAGWRRERMSEPPVNAFFAIAPDWISEVPSPSTEKYDKGDKRKIYALFGVEHLWHVDPRAQLLEVFARQDKDWLLTIPSPKARMSTPRPTPNCHFRPASYGPLTNRQPTVQIERTFNAQDDG